MIAYASVTGTKRNLAALKAAGWRLLMSRAGERNARGFRYALDNGAWHDFQQEKAFDVPAFYELLRDHGAGADWVVAPDIVAGGVASLDLSLSHLSACLKACPMALIAVQDGMEAHHLRPHVGPRVGIFLGGSTEWKLANMSAWGAFCRDAGVYYHVARVNSQKRIKEALASRADSFDGSSASKYALSLPPLDVMRRQRDLLL